MSSPSSADRGVVKPAGKVPASFADLGVSGRVVEALAERGIDEPFAIQRAVIGDVLAGRDVLAKSPTGSGKTLAFAIPIVERLRPGGRGPSALVLAPTRELAAQIVEQSQPLARARGLEVTAVYGGVGFEKQIKAARRADVLVATPGRLEDLMARRAVSLERVRILVLDEADRMLDMGFRPAVDRIVGSCPSERQTLFFSATLDGEAGRIAAEYTDDAVLREHVPPPVEAPQIEHRFVPVVHERKLDALVAELRAERGLTLVFVRTKRGADRLVKRLARDGVDAVAMHGDKTQAQREKALARFESGKVDTLVATDVAARGIHVGGISHVINFDPPEDREGYVHRVGRTGRAGRTGVGITFVNADQAGDVAKIAAALDLHREYEHAGFARPAERSERAARPHASGGPKRRRYGSSRGGRNRW
jgi:ATP-dependent RNA helicase RhlE